MCHGAGFDSDCFRGRPGCIMGLGLIVIISGGGRMCYGTGFDCDRFQGRPDVTWRLV